MNKILIVEDEPAIRESLEDFFRGHEYLAESAASLGGAVERLARDRYALILLDLSLPDGDGITILRDLRARGLKTPVIILTARGIEEWRVRGLEAGADDYVIKPFSVHELLARVRAVLRRITPPPSTVTIGDAEVDFTNFEIRRNGVTHRMASKEAELLAHFVRHGDHVHRRDELLREVWCYDESPSTRTVDTHVFYLRQKIEAAPDAPRHLLTIHGVGYRFVP